MLATLALLAISQLELAPVGGVQTHCAENIRGKQGRARVEVVVGAGALHESDAERGAAHLLEHLLIRPLGYDHNNGETSWDYTSYFSDVDAPDLEEASRKLLESLQSPDFSEEVFGVEREVVIREIEERGEHTPSLIRQVFGHTIFDRPLGGSIDELRSAQRDTVLDFHRRFYTKGNLAVLVRGSTSCASLLEALRPTLESFAEGTAAELPDEASPEPGSVRPSDLPPGTFFGGYYWFRAGISEELVMRVLAKHLQQRAFDELRTKLGITYSPEGRFVRMAGAGFAGVQVNAEGEEAQVEAWFEDTMTELVTSNQAWALLSRASAEVNKDLRQDTKRIALAAIRQETAPGTALSELDEPAVKTILRRYTSTDRRVVTSSGGVLGIIVLVAVGLGVLAFFGLVTLRVMKEA